MNRQCERFASNNVSGAAPLRVFFCTAAGARALVLRLRRCVFFALPGGRAPPVLLAAAAAGLRVCLPGPLFNAGSAAPPHLRLAGARVIARSLLAQMRKRHGRRPGGEWQRQGRRERSELPLAAWMRPQAHGWAFLLPPEANSNKK